MGELRDKYRKEIRYGAGEEPSILFGVKVSDMVFDEYWNKDYRDLITNYPYEFIPATMRDLIECCDYFTQPDYAKECEKALETIREEVYKKYREKEVEEMKRLNFSTYFETSKAVYENARTQYLDLRNKMEKTENALHEADKNRSMFSEEDYLLIKANYVNAKRNFEEGVPTIRREMENGIKDVRKAFESALNSFYMADPNKIDSNTLTLLNSGILKDSELVALAEQNIHNPTMFRLIVQEAGKRKSTECKILKKYTDDDMNGSKELKAFDKVTYINLLGLDPKSTLSINMENHYDELYNEAVSPLANMPVKPLVEEA